MKHLLKITDLTKDEFINILDLADELKAKQKQGIPHELCKGKTLGMIFTKSSTRTRVSFETGIYQLGGQGIFLNQNDIQLGRGESIEDTAKVLSRYVDGIMIRTYKQSDVEDLAKYGDIPIINGLTDYCHPCQILADFQTIREKLGTLENINIAWIGDGNNVCNSVIAACNLLGIKITVACPKGYEPEVKGAIIIQNQDEAVADSNIIFTDVYSSMGQEAESEKRIKDFAGFKINADLMAKSPKGCLVQHCLPAHKGEEITKEVFDAHPEIFDEAENRLHAQKAVMAILMGEVEI